MRGGALSALASVFLQTNDALEMTKENVKMPKTPAVPKTAGCRHKRACHFNSSVRIGSFCSSRTQIQKPQQLFTMMRLSLVLLLSLPLVQGFGVVRPAFYQRTTLFAETPAPKETEVFTSMSMDKEEVDAAEAPVTTKAEPYFIEKNEPVVSKQEELSAKAQAAAKELSAKAQDFANDPKVKEISEKATEFTKEVFGNLFSQVGEKLKEMKKEKEMSQKK